MREEGHPTQTPQHVLPFAGKPMSVGLAACDWKGGRGEPARYRGGAAATCVISGHGRQDRRECVKETAEGGRSPVNKGQFLVGTHLRTGRPVSELARAHWGQPRLAV